MDMSLFCFTNEGLFFGANCSYIPSKDVCSFQYLVCFDIAKTEIPLIFSCIH